MSYYGDLASAQDYFNNRLFASTWISASPADRLKSLGAATRIIDALNFKGNKHPVYLLLFDDDGDPVCPKPTEAILLAADETQELCFPRGRDTVVPEQIRYAQYEIAIALLDGFDADLELENLRVLKQTYAAVRTTYVENDASSIYLAYGVPSGVAWRYLLPYLSDSQVLNIRRIS